MDMSQRNVILILRAAVYTIWVQGAFEIQRKFGAYACNQPVLIKDVVRVKVDDTYRRFHSQVSLLNFLLGKIMLRCETS